MTVKRGAYSLASDEITIHESRMYPDSGVICRFTAVLWLDGPGSRFKLEFGPHRTPERARAMAEKYIAQGFNIAGCGLINNQFNCPCGVSIGPNLRNEYHMMHGHMCTCEHAKGAL